jgi:hypothetical protein
MVHAVDYVRRDSVQDLSIQIMIPLITQETLLTLSRHMRSSPRHSTRSKHLKSLHIPLDPIQIPQLQSPMIHPSPLCNLLDIFNINPVMLQPCFYGVQIFGAGLPCCGSSLVFYEAVEAGVGVGDGWWVVGG